jgi:hypothetical protein
MDGHWWRWRKSRRDAGGMPLSSCCGLEAGKNDVIDFCRKGVMPLMFHEKMRIQSLSSGGRACGAAGICFAIGVVGPDAILRRLLGGGLISRLMLAKL